MPDLKNPRPIRLMVVGAQKAGTTSLLRYLSDHPGICTHSQVEMTYFVHDAEYELGYPGVFPRYFPCGGLEASVILAKSVSVMLLPKAIARLHAHNPQVQIVIMLRNPVDRAYSHYWYSKRRGWEDQNTFEAAIATNSNISAKDPVSRVNKGYLANGLYVNHLKQLMAFFDREQIHVILLEDLKESPVTVCQTIFGLFGELDTRFEPETERSHNTSATYRFRSLALLTSSRSTLPRIKKIGRKFIPDRTMDFVRDKVRHANEQAFTPPPLDLETRAQLLAYFKPYNQQLSELIGRDLDHWNK